MQQSRLNFKMKRRMMILLMSVLLCLEPAQGFPDSEAMVPADGYAVGQAHVISDEKMVEVSGEGVKPHRNPCDCSRQRKDFVDPTCLCKPPPKTVRKSKQQTKKRRKHRHLKVAVAPESRRRSVPI